METRWAGLICFVIGFSLSYIAKYIELWLDKKKKE